MATDRYTFVCKRAIQLAKAGDFTEYAGVEPEFIVMKYDEEGRRVKAFDDNSRSGFRPRRHAFGYDVEFTTNSVPFLKDMIDIIQGMGWNL